jgi:hypothetical protein
LIAQEPMRDRRVGATGAPTVQVNVVEIFPIFVVMLTAAAMALVRLSV